MPDEVAGAVPGFFPFVLPVHPLENMRPALLPAQNAGIDGKRAEKTARSFAVKQVPQFVPGPIKSFLPSLLISRHRPAVPDRARDAFWTRMSDKMQHLL